MTRVFSFGRWRFLVHSQADGGMVWRVDRYGVALRWLLLSAWRQQEVRR